MGLPVGPADAQTQTATLEGRVTDEQDAALVGATVTVVSDLLPQSKVTVTDSTGEYRLSDLPAGISIVTINITGFQTKWFERVVLQAGSIQVLSLTLPLAALSQEVDVVDVAPALGSGVSQYRLPATIALIQHERS